MDRCMEEWMKDECNMEGRMYDGQMDGWKYG